MNPVAVYLIKLGISAGVIVLVSELAKRVPTLGALVLSLPLSSILALTLLYSDTKNQQLTALLARDTFWMLIPSLIFFPLFVMGIRGGFGFVKSMATAGGLMMLAYAGFSFLLQKMKV